MWHDSQLHQQPVNDAVTKSCATDEVRFVDALARRSDAVAFAFGTAGLPQHDA
jgi:hypothetical protein